MGVSLLGKKIARTLSIIMIYFLKFRDIIVFTLLLLQHNSRGHGILRVLNMMQVSMSSTDIKISLSYPS